MNTFAHTNTDASFCTLPFIWQSNMYNVRQQINVEPCKGQCTLYTIHRHKWYSAQSIQFQLLHICHVQFCWQNNTLQSNRIMKHWNEGGVIKPEYSYILYHPSDAFIFLLIVSLDVYQNVFGIRLSNFNRCYSIMSDGNCSVSPRFISIHHTYNFLKESYVIPIGIRCQNRFEPYPLCKLWAVRG